ncbi:sialic acid O-acetyltransferase [Flavobacterium sp. NST-5]|uniref:Sialic acid O-acetyltransferase n=1 Tax=Flavobacterium ichthyis TaxID=2698827 RepID=A0ABW9Z8B9_9FLAO|nr:acetyltransferase [Flavobacterium ichthyis]NBL64822.1 sialic acid O-acetyltransferase [Flavobacterium ichthyis]
MKSKCIIVGAGTYGQVYAEYLKDFYDIIGYIDDNETLLNSSIKNIKVIGNRDFLLNKVDKAVSVFVPIGNNVLRVEILKELKQAGFKTPSFIHPQTVIHKSVKIGDAVYILPGTYIMPDTVIENSVMISMGVNIAHHTNIATGCFFSQGTNIGASIEIKEYAYHGIASTVMTGVKTIGKNALIGAGTVIIRDVPDFAVVVGNPGKIIKYNSES